MKKIIFIFIVLMQHVLFAQNEGNIWYFGENAGIDFNSGTPVALTNGALYSFKGCASICDANGVFQFYTNGMTVWNRNHLVMLNGTGLAGHHSSTQSAIIVKKPGANTIYFIFTTDEYLGTNGLRYSEVDMSLQGGLGGVNANKNIPIVTPTCEKVTAIRNYNNTGFWIVTHLFNSNSFHSYLLTAAGINLTPVVSNIGSISNVMSHPIGSTGIRSYPPVGHLKGSPDGNRIAQANSGDNVELFDFDNATGLLSNPITLHNYSPNHSTYGIEFSPNNNLLYVSESEFGPTNIYQYNLLAGSPTAIINSGTIINQVDWIGALQLAPDNKIYCARHSSSFSLGVINNPNLVGAACNYVANGFSLAGKRSKFGLPNFYNSINNPTTFTVSNLCVGDSALFVYSSSNIIDSVLWNFDDPLSGTNNTSKDASPKHVFTNAGAYNVSLITYVGTSSDTTINLITIKPTPTINFGNDRFLCEGETLILDATTPGVTYLWQDNSTNPTLNVTQQGNYWAEVTVNNCSSADTILVNKEACEIMLELPTVFTPNNDGMNDLFVPIISNGIALMHTTIYNRWGNNIYETNNLLIEWNGEEANDGTYFWMIAYTDINGVENNLKGYLTLLK